MPYSSGISVKIMKVKVVQAYGFDFVIKPS